MMKTSVEIREATASDLNVIVGFNLAMALETEQKGLDDTVLRNGVRRALAHPESGPYFLAERSGRVVGQCMVTHEWSDWRSGWFWWFQSVYIAPEHRRSGVFRSLYAHVEKLARACDDVVGLRLYVEHTNETAMQTYGELGMRPSGHVVYETDWSNVSGE